MNNNKNISKMNADDCNTNNNYGPFNNNRRNKNRKQNKEQSKVIHITHNHYTGPPNNKPQINLPSSDTKDDINKERIAKEVINRFSFDKPVIGNPQDRYTPMFFSKSSNGSPINFNGEILHIVHPNLDMPTAKPPPIPEDKSNEHEDEFEEIIITNEIKHITDLIDLSNKHIIKPNVKYSIDLPKLKKIVPHLQELNNMIGMEDIKKSLSYQLMYFLQGFEFKHMLHTIIEGPPGVGKTCLGKLLGQIYLELGCINSDVKPQDIDDDDGPMNIKKLFSNILNQEANNNQPKKIKFKIAKRSDLVGQYVGHTAVKTQKVINESFGGVLFIDEAYSLGGDDVFSKECINTINQNLSENGDKFICIIAGYADALENSFFSQNSGLHRRFPFRYKIEKYNGDELAKILNSKLQAEKYTIETNNFNFTKYIEDNKESFPNYGGDIETYFFHMKIMHSTRVFGKSVLLRNIFIKDDFINALKEMKKHEKKEEDKPNIYT
jgi:hypothetical protein